MATTKAPQSRIQLRRFSNLLLENTQARFSNAAGFFNVRGKRSAAMPLYNNTFRRQQLSFQFRPPVKPA